MCSALFSQTWVAKYNERVFYEQDLYGYVQKKDWITLDVNKKRSVLLDFLKQDMRFVLSDKINFKLIKIRLSNFLDLR